MVLGSGLFDLSSSVDILTCVLPSLLSFCVVVFDRAELFQNLLHVLMTSSSALS